MSNVWSRSGRWKGFQKLRFEMFTRPLVVDKGREEGVEDIYEYFIEFSHYLLPAFLENFSTPSNIAEDIFSHVASDTCANGNNVTKLL